MLCGNLTILTLYISNVKQKSRVAKQQQRKERKKRKKTQPLPMPMNEERDRAMMMMMNEFYVHMTTFTNN